jgi:hypothetical protein
MKQMNITGKYNKWHPHIIFSHTIHLRNAILINQAIILKQKQNIAPTWTIDHSLTVPERLSDTISSPST